MGKMEKIENELKVMKIQEAVWLALDGDIDKIVDLLSALIFVLIEKGIIISIEDVLKNR